MYPLHHTKIQEVWRTVERAERDLGTLTTGQRIDLLLDNCPWIRNVEDARNILADIYDVRRAF